MPTLSLLGTAWVLIIFGVTSDGRVKAGIMMTWFSVHLHENTIKYIHCVVVFCFVLTKISVYCVFYPNSSGLLQVSCVFVWFSQCQWSKPERYESNRPVCNKSKIEQISANGVHICRNVRYLGEQHSRYSGVFQKHWWALKTKSSYIFICGYNTYLSMYGQDILCGIPKVSFEIPDEISYPYIERCIFYATLKF